ncbi:hypothetical protein [Deinococcus sp.]|uniref:hypothetical protein n=1 Tax=Deinococcus sp. TaxID=47478 RepID=UPI003C7C1B86
MTRGLDLLALPRGTRLHLGTVQPGMGAVAEVTGLPNPCAQLDGLQAGLMAAVLEGGELRPGDPVWAELPAPPYLPLERV